MGVPTNRFEEIAANMKVAALGPAVTAASINAITPDSNTFPLAYFVAIDLDNANGLGPYRHDGTKRNLKLHACRKDLVKGTAADGWGAGAAVITAIDQATATLDWPCPCRIGPSANPGDSPLVEYLYPFSLDYTVEGGKLKNALSGALGDVLVTDQVNTSAPLKNANNEDVIPAVGDVLWIVGNLGAFVGGGALVGDCIASACMWYTVE